MNRLFTFLLFFGLISVLSASPAVDPLYQPPALSWNSIYEFLHLPHHLNKTELLTRNIITVQAASADNTVRRPFDSEGTLSSGIRYDTFNRLNEKVTFEAGFLFLNDWEKMRARSLHKDFYKHQIGFTDTTTGNWEYNGPQINFSLRHQLLPNLVWGLHFDYAVERGLKDRYTRTFSIELNAAALVSLQWRISPSLAIDGFVKRHRDQLSMEAVKEYSDVQVETWYGSRIYRLENPGASIDVNSIHSGYTGGGGLALFENSRHWEAYIGAEAGADGAAFKKGTRKDAADRGYEKRDLKRGNFWLQRKFSKGAVSFYARYHTFAEWTRPGYYQSLMAENNGSLQEAGLQMTYKFNKRAEINLYGQFLRFDETFQNYLSKYELAKSEDGWRFGVNNRIDPFPILAFAVGIEAERIPLNYTWDYAYANRYSIKCGGEYQFGLIRIIPSICYTFENFDDTNHTNRRIEGSISLSR
jgi:hypothetical protein